jgi:hypothetical protein
LFTNNNVFNVFTVVAGPVSITNALFTNDNSYYRAVVSGGLLSSDLLYGTIITQIQEDTFITDVLVSTSDTFISSSANDDFFVQTTAIYAFI